jgi:hypothetical protein
MRIKAIRGMASLLGLMSIGVFCPPVLAADPAKSSRPPKFQLADEPLLVEFSVAKAVEFLDKGAQATENGKCVNCHASFAYLMARPMLSLDSKRHAEVRSNLEKWVEYRLLLRANSGQDTALALIGRFRQSRSQSHAGAPAP